MNNAVSFIFNTGKKQCESVPFNYAQEGNRRHESNID